MDIRALLERLGWLSALVSMFLVQGAWGQSLTPSDALTISLHGAAVRDFTRDQIPPTAKPLWLARAQIERTVTLEPDLPVDGSCRESDGSFGFRSEVRRGRLCSLQYTFDVPESADGVLFVLDKPAGSVDMILVASHGRPLLETSQVFISRPEGEGIPDVEAIVCVRPRCPLGGRWFIGVGNFTPTPQEYVVAASFTPVALELGIPRRGTVRAASIGSAFLGFVDYTIDVPDGAAVLRIELETLTGADLFLLGRFGEPVTVDPAGRLLFDYEAFSVEGRAVLIIDASSSPPLRAGTYHMRVLNAESTRQNFFITAYVVRQGELRPTIGVEPAVLSFTTEEGRPHPAPQMLRILNTGTGTLSWQISIESTPSGWLRVAGATFGVAPSVLPVFIEVTDLGAGTYEGRIIITSEGAANSPFEVPVLLTITLSTRRPSPLEVEPPSLSFEAEVNGPNPDPQELMITNTGDITVTWSASPSAPWLSVDPSEGTLEPAQTANLLIRIDITGLPVGTLEGRITFSTAGFDPLIVPIALALRMPSQPRGELLILKFIRLEFAEPNDWEQVLQDGCVIYTNIGTEPSTIRVTLPNDTIRDFEVPPGNRVIVCGDVVHIDTRRR
jgi:hypothetical protein